jgi:SAM-dependent methyltransferase
MNQPCIRDFIAWDVRNWARAIPCWKKVLENKNNLTGLEIGAGGGGLSLWLASLPQTRQVFCTDKEKTAEKVSPLLRRFPQFSSKITCLDLDVADFTITEKYDVVIMKSCLGISERVLGQDGRKKFLKKIAGSLKSGGIYLFAENTKGSMLHQFLRKKFIPWYSRWDYPALNELKQDLELFFTDIKIHSHGFWATMGRNEFQRRFLSYADDLTCLMIPDSWKYFCYGYAVKK